jgi:hypothetical protein
MIHRFFSLLKSMISDPNDMLEQSSIYLLMGSTSPRKPELMDK